MINHEHYLGWTIEWEKKGVLEVDFWICTDWIYPKIGSTMRVRYWIDIPLGPESGVKQCKELIDRIIDDQKYAGRKVVADFNSEMKKLIDSDDSDDTEEEVEKNIDL